SGENYIYLDEIHFIKVQTGMMGDVGWLGEISTEITGAVDVAPDPGLTGTLDIIVIKDLPPILDTTHLQLEAFFFHAGRMLPNVEINWETNAAWASIDEDDLLSVTNSGELLVKAYLATDSSVNATASCKVELPAFLPEENDMLKICVFPNPAGNYVSFKGVDRVKLELFDISGNKIIEIENYAENERVDINDFPGGLYLARITDGRMSTTVKLIKK
ncbi:MAG: T9SS type A sorting domain-containing protein, partial [Bacteroidales bacterium]|nr:T9SS type A sorting domain-containing protein [Bacteroidales bacterium]